MRGADFRRRKYEPKHFTPHLAKPKLYDLKITYMKLKELREVKELLDELWDFFTTNSDGDETGIQKEVGEKYRRCKEHIGNDFYKLHLRNELQKNRRK